MLPFLKTGLQKKCWANLCKPIPLAFTDLLPSAGWSSFKAPAEAAEANVGDDDRTAEIQKRILAAVRGA
ncbi:hypothetical protein [Methylorubrum extorquens]|uniref:hypothetical protein n=1 Tax=Methylorubrum extorquens TaxID=408 RepID=UPI0011BED89B|nr:hypothetical protein [Methylorubrum extorquens]